MGGNFKGGKTRQPVNTAHDIWCPFCDWHVSDSMASRRRLGVHVGNFHYADVAFPVGEEPEDLEEDNATIS